MKERWETKIPEKSENHINEWADYVELCCLIHDDIVSMDDILDIACDSRIIEPDMEDISGEKNALFDKYSEMVENAFSIIKYREKKMGDLYPFVLKDNCLELKNGFDTYGSIYVFLLFASSTRQVTSWRQYTKQFERMCGMLIKAVSFLGADNLLVGTSGSTDGKSVFDKTEKIAEKLKTSITASYRNSKRAHSPSGGDGGVDILSVRPFDDEYAFRPLILSQCTCSMNQWEDKQASIRHDIWLKRLSDLPRYIEMMWLPFSICDADGKPENPGNITTCVMDRYRIMELVKNDGGLINEFPFSEIIRQELG